MSYITSLAIANPPHQFKQAVIADFMVNAMQLSGDSAHKLRVLFRSTGIETRYSILEDYGRTHHFEFYKNTPGLEPFPSTKKRVELFRQHSVSLSQESAERCLAKHSIHPCEITHLIVVSCTGMYAPGLDIDLVKRLGLKNTIERTCINFMGCYASFNALKLADAFCTLTTDAKVLIVCTELCSLHFQKENTDDNLLANALFADGSAAVVVESKPRPGFNLKPLSFHCDLATENEREMAWTIGDWGFEMKLSAYVPDVIQRGIKKLTKDLLDKISTPLDDIGYFAIHPGGKRILEVVENELGLSPDQNRFSYAILKKYGNMSSPTVLFVLHEIHQHLTHGDNNKKVLSFAFGPGLTLESMVLSLENH
jgi:alpha-pyrone synthase